jgi:hypothetical protein
MREEGLEKEVRLPVSSRVNHSKISQGWMYFPHWRDEFHKEISEATET